MYTFLVYCEDNKNVADNLDENLKRVGINFHHYNRKISNRAEEFSLFSSRPEAPIVLLVSGNFLRSKDSMFEALNFLQNPALKSRITPIIIDDRKVSESGEVSYERTRFERVKDLYDHMNHWQDIYLDMRKMRKHNLVENENAFEQDLHVVRSISSEIGEFLRILRGREYFYQEDLYNSKFEHFFRRIQAGQLFFQFREMDIIPMKKEVLAMAEVSTSKQLSGSNKDTLSVLSKDDSLDSPLAKIKDIPEELTKIVEEKVDVLQPIENKEEVIVPEEKLEMEENLRSKLSDYKKDIEEINDQGKIDEPVIHKQNIEEVIAETVEEIKEEKQEKNLKKEQLEYEDKSSYDLLVSLFEDDVENVSKEEIEEEEELQEESIILESSINEDIPNLVEEVEEVDDSVEEEDDDEVEVEVDNDEEELDSEEEEESNDIRETIEKYAAELEEEDVPHSIEGIKALIEEGDHLSAMKILRETLAMEPDNHEARVLYMGVLVDKVEDYNGAQEQMDILVDAHPQNVGLRVRAAELAEETENYIQAKNHYEDALDLDEENPNLHFKLATLLNKHFRSQKKAAAKHYKEAAKLDENNVDALYQQATITHEHLGKTKKALKLFQQVMQKDPQHPFAHYDVAVLYYEMEKPKLAARHYYEAFQINPELRTKKNDEAFQVEKLVLAKMREEEARRKAEEEARLKAEEEERLRLEEEARLKAEEEERLRLEEEARLKAEEEERLRLEEEARLKAEEEERLRLEEEARLKAEEEERLRLEEEARLKAEEEERLRLEEEARLKAEEEERLRLEEEARLKAEEEERLRLEEEAKTQDVVLEEITINADALESDTYKLSAAPELQEAEEAKEDAEKSKTVAPATTTMAFITGATSGIGKATAELFASKGYNLIITGRRADRLETIKQALEVRHNISVEALTFDVRNAEACKQAIDSLPPRFRNVDILINNAGLAKGKEPIHQGSLEHWETMIDTNIKGLLYMTRLVAPNMVARGRGHIINVSSVAGKDVYPDGNVYCATKHAVDALTKAMRMDLYKHNIRVSAVSPGAVEDTEFSLVRHDGDAEKAKVYDDFQPLKASDVAEIIHFIASRPPHVNIQDVIAFGSQQASVHHTNYSGRK